ncbi:MAG: hypothetical protein RL745_526, partial [Actinomycetota bacterium]
MPAASESLPFAPATVEWFVRAFGEPTAAQSGAWQSISQGRHTLVVAPTGSGKTLAAFLSAIDTLAHDDVPADINHRCRVVYISPLKALASDIERNLRTPLVGIEHEFIRQKRSWPGIRAAVRTGDTPQSERTALVRNPPDILITTPESLYLMLTSSAREIFRGVTTVIIDEVHALAGNKRGAHLSLSLARLDDESESPIQRIGLSATVRPIATVARWLGGAHSEVAIVDPPSKKSWDIRVVVPVEDMSMIGSPTEDFSGSASGFQPQTSIWPHVESAITELISRQRSTIVFANSRRLAEKLTLNLNEAARSAREAADEHHSADEGSTHSPENADESVLARAHHGSVSKEQRAIIEEELKAGRLPAVVATSSLE